MNLKIFINNLFHYQSQMKPHQLTNILILIKSKKVNIYTNASINHVLLKFPTQYANYVIPESIKKLSITLIIINK